MPASHQSAQQLRDARIRLGGVQRVLLVIRLIVLLHGFRQLLTIPHSALCQRSGAIPHQIAVFIHRKLRQAVQPQRPVHGAGNILQGIGQRAVQIKHRCFHLNFLLHHIFLLSWIVLLPIGHTDRIMPD